jgi:asparagine synthase (glutamine-hydrolysing)
MPSERSPWRCSTSATDLFFETGGAHFEPFRFPDLTIFLRGYATFAGSPRLPCQEDIAQALYCHYLHHGTLPVEKLEGSFTVALLDGRDGKLLLYRNLVGTGSTYYAETPGGLLFAGNLTDLVDALGEAPGPNDGALPAFFLYRCVPGRETLFEGVFRLMPGEIVTWDPCHGLRRSFAQTLADLRRPRPRGADPVSLVEETLSTVVADCSALRPGMANLLSGGLDSSYLQVLWNRAARHADALPTFSVSVNHADTRRETDYALSAARWLGTRHTLVPVDGPYAEYLLETIAATGEPPNHAQAAYFPPLARAMVQRGVTTGLCGEGADNLFGVSLANRIQYARILRRLLPLGPLRRGLARLAAAVGWRRLHEYTWLADHLDAWADLRHPVNRVSAFTDWEAVHTCFGAGVGKAAAGRRALLASLRVAAEPLEGLHATGYFADAMDTAGLWTTLFNCHGGDLLCPFMDSRLLRLMFSLEPRQRYPFRRPKGLIKRGLARHAPRELVARPKLGFGQPVFEWLAPGGQLRRWVESIDDYSFVDAATLARVKERPTWFLYSLLCYDLWYKLFIDRSLPRADFAAPLGERLRQRRGQWTLAR